MYDLGKKDLKILKYIRKKNPTREKIRKRFLFDVDPRVAELRNHGYIYFNDVVEGWGNILEEGTSELSDKGLMTLENIIDEKRNERLSFSIRNIAIPIGVSIVTSILTTIITLYLSKLL